MEIKKVPFKLTVYVFYSIFLISMPGATLWGQSSTQGIWGLDLSHHQGNINWDLLTKVKPHFLYFKATEGSTHLDAQYAQNRKESAKLNIPTGAYHFFSFTSPGIRQALHFIKTAQLKKGDLPPVLDIEWIRPMPSISAVIREALTFLNTVEKELGVRPVIYTDCMLYDQFLKAGLKRAYGLWIASYQSKPDCNCLFWQKTNNYKIDGISGNVDYNLFMGNKKAFRDILIH